MMTARLFFVFTVLTVALAFKATILPDGLFKCKNPYTVENLNVTQYLGLWYNIAADRLVLNTFQTQYCVTAKYGLNTNGTVSVLNSQKEGGVNGTVETIEGWAKQSDPEDHPGRLLVSLNGGSRALAPYWVLNLGPVVNDQYSYAIVSDPVCAFMWVLARKPTLSAQDTATIQAYLTSVGFDLSTDYIPIYQEGCY